MRFRVCITSFSELSFTNTDILELWLTANRENKQAIRFCQKEGFQKTGCIAQGIDQGYVMDDYKMGKTINVSQCQFLCYDLGINKLNPALTLKFIMKLTFNIDASNRIECYWSRISGLEVYKHNDRKVFRTRNFKISGNSRFVVNINGQEKILWAQLKFRPIFRIIFKSTGFAAQNILMMSC